MSLLDLSPEIHVEIFRFCSSSDLASLSRVHTSLQDTAEHMLYGHIYLLTRPSQWVRNEGSWTLVEDRPLLHTLTTSATKAAMVKFLHIELDDTDRYVADNGIGPVLIRLSRSLKKSSYLIDLRIVFHSSGDPSGGQITDAIRGGHFQLDTLWLESGHNLAGILADQPNLRLLGICYDDHADTEYFRRKVEGLFRNPMPTICMMKGLKPWSPAIEMFPSSHHPGKVTQECRDIARSLREFSRVPNLAEAAVRCLTFNLFGMTSENVNLLVEVMEGMATCLSDLNVKSLQFNMDDTTIWSWVFSGFVRVLPLFETVENLNIDFGAAKLDEAGPFITDMQRLVKDLGKTWPKVQQVCLYGESWWTRCDRDSGWVSKFGSSESSSGSDEGSDDNGDL